MLSLYYKIWVDAIVLAKKRNGETGNWKLLTIIPFSIIQGINLLTIFLFIRILSRNETLALMPINIFNTKPLNLFLSVLVTYFIPFLILNYLLIFSNGQYNNLLKTYKDKGGKLYLKYIYTSIGIITIPMVLVWLF